MTTLEFIASESNAVRTRVTESVTTGRGSRRVPFTIPSSETYYWSTAWQRDEAETLRDEERVIFDSGDPEDAVKWLREPGD